MAANGDLVRATGQHAIYVIEDSQRRWIPDMATFYDWEFNPAVVKNLSQAELDAIPLGAPLPHSSRFIFDEGKELGANHYMRTRGAMSTRTGHIHASTRTLTRTWFGGYHGGVILIFEDAESIVIGSSGIHVFGVDGTYIGTSDREDAWQDDIGLDIVNRTVNIRLSQGWMPNQLKDQVQRAIDTGRPVMDLILDIKGIARTSDAVGKE